MTPGRMSTASLVAASLLISAFMVGFLPGVVLLFAVLLILGAVWVALP